MESIQVVRGWRFGGWRRGRRWGEGGAGVRGAGVEGCCCSFCCSCESLGLDDSGDGGVDAEFDAFAELEGFGAFIAAAHGRIEARWEADAGTCAVSGSQGGKASSCTQKAMSFFFLFPLE